MKKIIQSAKDIVQDKDIDDLKDFVLQIKNMGQPQLLQLQVAFLRKLKEVPVDSIEFQMLSLKIRKMRNELGYHSRKVNVLKGGHRSGKMLSRSIDLGLSNNVGNYSNAIHELNKSSNYVKKRTGKPDLPNNRDEKRP